MSKAPYIQPQRRNKGSKQWVPCAPHQAQRFALVAAKTNRVINAWPTFAAANQQLQRMLKKNCAVDRLQTPTLGARYGELRRPIIARSLTEAERQHWLQVAMTDPRNMP